MHLSKIIVFNLKFYYNNQKKNIDLRIFDIDNDNGIFRDFYSLSISLFE